MSKYLTLYLVLVIVKFRFYMIIRVNYYFNQTFLQYIFFNRHDIDSLLREFITVFSNTIKH